MNYERALRTALDAALEAGELLRREFHRWGGPRGSHGHAEADEEAEWLIRNRLLAAFPDFHYRGEETGTVEGSGSEVWVVDPNDGTSAFLRGARGSSVSIALISNAVPVLGVVYAFSAPDDRGDLIYWAEEFELTRNGAVVRPSWRTADKSSVILLLSPHRESLMESVLDTIQPYRYRAFPSIAYRLALAAVGDGEAAVSWHNPGDWDYAAGHALLRGAAGIFVNEQGSEVEYTRQAVSKVKRCFGGSPEIVRDLWRRDWGRIQSMQMKRSEPQSPRSLFLSARLMPGRAMADSSLLSRAQGTLLGQVCGDALGQQVEFSDPQSIARLFPNSVNKMQNGGFWNTVAGQPTDDSELALLLARSMAAEGRYVREKVAVAYHYWFSESEPFDIGGTISRAFRSVSSTDLAAGRTARTMEAGASPDSQANGSLMRISPLAVYGCRKSEQELWNLAETESRLTHPHVVCRQCCALYVIAIALALQKRCEPERLYRRVLNIAERREVEAAVWKALQAASHSKPDFLTNAGWVLVAFQNAFYQLLHSNTFESGLVATVMEGGDSDTNAAIAGALLGSVYGRDAVPFQWRQMVLSCRPYRSAAISHPRPFCFWPVDLLNLAELLLLC